MMIQKKSFKLHKLIDKIILLIKLCHNKANLRLARFVLL
jgi:hypothetical protein